MSIIENLILKIIKKVMAKSFNLDAQIEEISTEGFHEYNNIRYLNRAGEYLQMDIIKPFVNDPSEKLPVIVNIHGGGLIAGKKELSTGFCRLLAQKGYLVFSLEYRLVPDVRVYEQIDDVCAGMDFVRNQLAEYNGDPERVFLTAESAGAFLSLYAVAMQDSPKLQTAIGYQPSQLSIKAMGLISGMFYTTRKDKVGISLSRSVYGKGQKRVDFLEYTNPECDEITDRIPPVFLVTSKADMLENYTLDFEKMLTKKGIEHGFLHMGNDPKFLHAFPVIRADFPESQQVINKMLDWFQQYECETISLG